MDSTNTAYSIHSICRICLENLNNDNAYDLFLIPGLAKKLVVCTSLTVEPQDGFPKNICGVCYTRLNDLHNFQKLCVDSVQKFQEMVASHIFDVPKDQFDILDASCDDIDDGPNAVLDDDVDRMNFDPLLNHKLELIENEEDVFKMLESVEKEAEEVENIQKVTLIGVHVIPAAKDPNEKPKKKVDVKKPNEEEKPIPTVDTAFDSDSASDFDNDDDEDFKPSAIVYAAAPASDSDDDKPLAWRLRNTKRKPKRKQKKIKEEVDEDNAEGGEVELDEDGKPKKVKRKRVPLAERRVIECHVCHQKFKKEERYKEHMNYHNDKLPHQCTIKTCLKGFTTSNGLRLHIEHCHAETLHTIPCPEEGCGRMFPRQRLLNWHLKKVHKISKELIEPKCYPCTECEKVFRCPMALKKHMYKHDGKELPFPCNICGKRFVINSALKDHLMRHAGIKNYVCPYCGVGKTTRQEWNTHINTHTQEKKFKCSLCPHASHNKQNLRMHVKIVHEKIKDYACQYCGKTFGKSNACKMHEMTHTGEKRCECKVCGKRFLYPKGLTKHLKTHEKRVMRAIEVYRKRQVELGHVAPDDSPPPLPEIPIPLNHTQETHSKVAEEILKACAESAATIPTDPRRVQRVDISELAGTAVNPIPEVAVPSWSPQINFMMKEGPHICPDCGQGFNGLGNLKRHHRIVHEGVKDFACRFCLKRFAKAQTLKHHEMTHTGEKPHVCKTCGKAFIQYVALKRHWKVHSSKAPTLSASMYEAREELEYEERRKIETRRLIEKQKKEVAEKALEQLEQMQKEQQEELERQQSGRATFGAGPETELKQEETEEADADATGAAADDVGDGMDEDLPDPGPLGDFPHINTSTMHIRTEQGANVMGDL